MLFNYGELCLAIEIAAGGLKPGSVFHEQKNSLNAQRSTVMANYAWRLKSRLGG